MIVSKDTLRLLIKPDAEVSVACITCHTVEFTFFQSRAVLVLTTAGVRVHALVVLSLS